MKALLLAIVLGLALPVLAEPGAKPQVRIDTSYGPIVVELEPERAPRTVANFLAYVKEGFYGDTIFHREFLRVLTANAHPQLISEDGRVVELATGC